MGSKILRIRPEPWAIDRTAYDYEEMREARNVQQLKKMLKNEWIWMEPEKRSRTI
jgi:hypothetical protein